LTIRLMTLDDYDEVYALWKNTPGMGMNDTDDSREGVGRYLARNPSTCFVATENDRVIGAILGGHDGRRAYIYHTAVSQAHRGQGIGHKLVQSVTEALEREGMHKAALLAFRCNEGGNAFWERQGFTERTDVCYRNRALDELGKQGFPCGC